MNRRVLLMKKIICTIIATTIILTFFTGCYKVDRSKYIGTWEFTIELITSNLCDPNYEIDMANWKPKRDTLHYIGKIRRGNTDNELYIEYFKDHSVFAKVNRAGELSGNIIEGYFRKNNNLQLILYNHWDELNCPVDLIIDAVKIKRGGNNE